MLPLTYLSLFVLVHCISKGYSQQADFPPSQVQVQTNYQANQQASSFPVAVPNQGGYTGPSAGYQQSAPAAQQQAPYSNQQNNYPQQQPPPSPQPQPQTGGGYSSNPVGGYATYSYPQVAYGPPPKPKFLAAPPGMTPACAKYGGTFCEKIDDYPTEQVHYLLYKFGKFIEPFMTSETNEKPPEHQPMYGGYDYAPKPYYPTYNYSSYGGYGGPPPAPPAGPQYPTPIRFEANPSNTYTYQNPETVQKQPQFQQPTTTNQNANQLPQPQQQYQEPNPNYQPQQQHQEQNPNYQPQLQHQQEPSQNFQPQQQFQEPLQNYPQHQYQDPSLNYQPLQQQYQEPVQNFPQPQVPQQQFQQSPNAAIPPLQLVPNQYPEANYTNFQQPQQPQPYLDQQSTQPFQYTGALTPPAPPLKQQQQQSANFANVPAAPPVSPSYWWNHQDTTSNKPAYPYITEHRYNSARKRRQASGGESLCGARNRNTAPRAAMNKNGVWMYVVNEVLEESKYRQTVIVEECTDPGKPCSGLCTLPAGYTSSCVQKNTQKRLIALDPSGNSFVQDTFFFPSCCQCRLAGRT